MSAPNTTQQYICDTAASHNVCTKNTVLIEEERYHQVKKVGIIICGNNEFENRQCTSFTIILPFM